MLNNYFEIISYNRNNKIIQENSWNNHSKVKTMKNFKTHKKLISAKSATNLMKYCRYRTNNHRNNCCNLILYVTIFQIFLTFITVTNCSNTDSELHLNLLNNNISSNQTHIITRSNYHMLPYKISDKSNFNSNRNSERRTSPLLFSGTKTSVTPSSLSYLSNQSNSNKKRLIELKNNNNNIVNRIDSNNTNGNRNNDIRRTAGNTVKNRPSIDLEDKLPNIVMEGLGLKSLPDASKMNISQEEYTTKLKIYLDLVKKRKRRELQEFYSNDEVINNIIEKFETTIKTYIHNVTDTRQYSRKRRRRRSTTLDNNNNNNANVVYVRFPIHVDNKSQKSIIDEANLRLLLVKKAKSQKNPHSIGHQCHHYRHCNINHHHTHQHHQQTNENQEHQQQEQSNHLNNNENNNNLITLKIYQLIEPYGKIWLDSKEIPINDGSSAMNYQNGSSFASTYRRWLEFDVTKAVKSWISGERKNIGLEIHCDRCHHFGAYVIEDHSINAIVPDLNPVLNIIGKFYSHHDDPGDSNIDNNSDDDNDGDGDEEDNDNDDDSIHRKKRSQHHHFMQNSRRKVRKTDCYKENQKCCRHTMEVVFKEIKGFEFIIQPKVFDAGYCRGKCPPRYNPAHHHAFLQSLIWKQDRTKVPRPCCAPSKLVELEVLHVDENDNKKLKVSTWSDMRVLECACS